MDSGRDAALIGVFSAEFTTCWLICVDYGLMFLLHVVRRVRMATGSKDSRSGDGALQTSVDPTFIPQLQLIAPSPPSSGNIQRRSAPNTKLSEFFEEKKDQVNIDRELRGHSGKNRVRGSGLFELLLQGATEQHLEVPRENRGKYPDS